MSKFCTNCGAEISLGLAFCPSCGVAAPGESAAQSAPPAAAPVSAAPQSAPTPLAAAPASAPVMPPQPAAPYPQRADAPPMGRYAVMSTGAYFGLMVLFAIPVIGWIACIAMMCSSNENRKHFAKAIFILFILGLVLSLISFLLLRWLGLSFTNYLEQELEIGSWQQLMRLSMMA